MGIIYSKNSFFHNFVACCSLGINILLQHTIIGVDNRTDNENTPTFKCLFYKMKNKQIIF
jgi:hypothetical protein